MLTVNLILYAILALSVYSPYITVNILLLHPLLIFKQSFSVRSFLSDYDVVSRGQTAIFFYRAFISLAWPDPLRPGAYRLEIISTGLLGFGIVHSR